MNIENDIQGHSTKNFDLLEEALNKAPSFLEKTKSQLRDEFSGNRPYVFYILALRGDTDIWASPDVSYKEKGSWTRKKTDSIKFRKSESYKSLQASVTVWNDDTLSLSSKTLYRNTKGIYFNSGASSPKVYIQMCSLPDHMK